MKAPSIGTYFMTGKVNAIRRTTDSDCSHRQAIELEETAVEIRRIKDFGVRWVAQCKFLKMLMPDGATSRRSWYGHWIVYEFAINDKTDISMRKVR